MDLLNMLMMTSLVRTLQQWHEGRSLVMAVRSARADTQQPIQK